MNQFYDKILLALAVLALAGGSAVFFTGKPSADAPSSDTGDRTYDSVPVPQSEFPEVTWAEPVAQPSGFIYDVFTPFEIFIDKNGNFTQVGPNIKVFANTFGDPYLVGIERPLYRIQMEGFIVEDPADPSKILILMYDIEKQQSVRARAGREYADAEFRVEDFRVDRIEEGGAVYKVAYTTITDLRTGEQVVLNDNEEQFNSGFSATIGSRENASLKFKLSEVGATFSTAEGDYSLDSIDLETKTVTVTKVGDDFNDPITEVLSVEEFVNQEVTVDDEAEENIDFNANDVSFDEFF
ncbi:MAG: hypothetical protein ACON39_00860 [Coraliomargaritaceae bacterium]